MDTEDFKSSLDNIWSISNDFQQLINYLSLQIKIVKKKIEKELCKWN